METRNERTLCELNRQIHDEHEEIRLDFLAALLVLDWSKARWHFDRFRRAFSEHVEREEAVVLPRLQSLLETREGPQEKWDAHLQGDHIILQRSLKRIDAALHELTDGGASHRDLAKELDTFVQLGRVLEHHHSREDRVIYPHLDENLSTEEAGKIKKALLGEGSTLV